MPTIRAENDFHYIYQYKITIDGNRGQAAEGVALKITFSLDLLTFEKP